MGSLMEVVRRLRALEAGRALPATSHLHVAIQPHALVVTPLVLAGEDTAIHSVAIGPIGRPPRLYSVPDPRRRDDVYRLFAWMAEIMEPYFQHCLGAETYPQVWVGSTPAARLLDIVSERIRFTQQHPTVQRLGLLLAYPAQRLSHGGQQTLMVATQALGLHFATGQDRSEDEHLGAQLAWILPPRGVPVLDAVAAAELRPAGVNTDPLFDKTTLMPLVAGYTHARRAKAPSAVLQRHARAIEAVLTPVVRAIHHDVQRAIRVLQRDPRPPLPELMRLEEREADEFKRYMAYIATGRAIPRRDKPFGAALTLAAREESLELAEAIARTSDRAARASARLAGDILCGTVQNLQALRPAPRRLVYQFEIVTSQRSPRVRPRDRLYWIDNPALCVEVIGHQRQGAQTRVLVRIVKGMRKVGPPTVGATLEWTDAPPDWDKARRERSHLIALLRTPPWTHSGNPLPPRRPLRGPLPANLLQAVEALR